VTRRGFLRVLGGASAAWLRGPGSALAIGARSKLVLGRLVLPGASGEERQGALARLVFELTLRTSVVASFDSPARGAEDPDLFDTPFLYLSGRTGFPALSEAAVRALRRHLEFGGTLLCDDGSGVSDSEFARSVKREALRIFPEAPLQALPDEHSIFRSYYLLRRIGGRTIVSPFLEGGTLDDRTPLILCRNDLGGAWAQDGVGRWLFSCSPGGEAQRQQAFALGVNLVLYALTVNYKQDQIHLPFILERMRRR
jgi:hypothetical protein